MPTVEVPPDDSMLLADACAGQTFSMEVEGPAGAEVRLSTNPSVHDGEVIRDGRVVDVAVPETETQLYAKAYNTGGGPATVYFNRAEGAGLTVERGSPTVIDSIREDLTLEVSASNLYDKFATFDVTGNYSHQFDPNWTIGEIGFTIVTDYAELQITAGDDDSDQMPFQSPMTFDQTEVQYFKIHDPQDLSPRVAGWYSGFKR